MIFLFGDGRNLAGLAEQQVEALMPAKQAFAAVNDRK